MKDRLVWIITGIAAGILLLFLATRIPDTSSSFCQSVAPDMGQTADDAFQGSAEEMKELSELRAHLDDVFNHCTDLQDAQARLNAWKESGEINDSQYVDLWDAATHYYAGTVHESLMYRRRIGQQ